MFTKSLYYQNIAVKLAVIIHKFWRLLHERFRHFKATISVHEIFPKMVPLI